MKKCLLFVPIYFLLVDFLQAQNVGIGTTNPNESAVLDIVSTSKGIILPRLTTAARIAITTPAQGLTVFDTDTRAYWYFNGNAWEKLLSQSESQNTGYGGWGDCAANYNVSEYNPVGDPNAQAGDFFGRSVAISGDFAIVGAWQDDDVAGTDQGAAVIFKRNSNTGQWEFKQKLFNNNAAPMDYFGHAVSIYNDVAFVGAYGDDDIAGIDQGSVCIFKRNSTTDTWEFQQKLFNQTAAAEQHFGISVATYGDYILIGSNRDTNGSGTTQGSASFFKKNIVTGTWDFAQKITHSQPASNDNFGFAVGIYKEYAIVGSDGDDDATAIDQGTAHIYKLNVVSGVWEFQQKLVDSDAALSDRFGVSVSITENYAMVGAYLDDDTGGSNQGSATVFKRDATINTWNFQQKFFNASPDVSENFGISVAIGDEYAMVGANLDDGLSGVDQGSATIYKRVGNFWQRMQFLTDPSGNADDRFGSRVILEADTKRFAVCANNSAGGKGKVIFGKIN